MEMQMGMATDTAVRAMRHSETHRERDTENDTEEDTGRHRAASNRRAPLTHPVSTEREGPQQTNTAREKQGQRTNYEEEKRSASGEGKE